MGWLTARMLARHDAEICHEMTWRGEPREVTDLGDQRGRQDQTDTLQRLNRRDDRMKRPFPGQLGDLVLELLLARLGLQGACEEALEGDLLPRMLEASIGEPYAMAHAPGLGRIPLALLEEKHLHMRPGMAHILGRKITCSDQITHGFVHRIRHPDEGQFAGPAETRQLLGIANVILDPFARRLRRPARCHNAAGAAEPGQLPVQAIAAGTGLVDKRRPPMAFLQLPHQLADGKRIIVDLAVATDLSAALGLRQRNHDRALVHIEAHEDIWTVHHPSSCQSVPNPPT